LIYRWLPQEEKEIDSLQKNIEKSQQELSKKNEDLKKEIIERKLVEKEIRNNAENLEVIFNSTPNILVLVNDEGRVEMINHKGASFLGRDKKELLGLSAGQVFNCLNAFEGKSCGRNSECAQCPVGKRIMSTFETGKPHTDEEDQMIFLLNDKETPLDFLISTDLLKLNGDNKVLLCLADITNRKIAENALIEARQSFEAIIDFLPDPTFVIDNDKKVVAWNRAIEEITGISKKDILNHGDDEYSIPFWGEARKTFINYIIDRQDVITDQYENLKKNNDGLTAEVFLPDFLGGKYLWLKASPLYDQEKNIIGAIESIRDITERKQSELEINKFKIMSDKANYGSAIVDLEGNFEYVNNFFAEIHGYSSDELIGQNLSMFHNKNQMEDVNKINSAIIKKGSYSVLEVWHSHKNGTEFPMLMNGNILTDENGKPQYITATAIDISERKKLEAQLQQSQKLETIGTLAGGIAHDFNNILFPIVGHAEMLLEDFSDKSPTRSSLNEIYTSALRAKDLVNQILTFSRQEKIELKLLRMQPIIEETLKLSRATIPATITIIKEIQADCGLIKADPTQIHQIMMNLTTNAYHAMEDTGGELTVSLEEINLKYKDLSNSEMIPGLFACLTVTDTGIGMNKKLIDKIFNPFFTTKEKGKGTGMGLSVVHGIVTSLGGSIEIFSTPGQGTKIYTYIPIQGTTPEKKEELLPPIQYGSEHVLLVDDEESILTMERLMLKRLGYQVTSRTSPIEALKAFRTNPNKFDLVITDLAMPNMSGDKLSMELLRIKSDTRIILCTGFSEKITPDVAKAMGVAEILLKPIVKKKLAAKIREVLDC